VRRESIQRPLAVLGWDPVPAPPPPFCGDMNWKRKTKPWESSRDTATTISPPLTTKFVICRAYINLTFASARVKNYGCIWGEGHDERQRTWKTFSLDPALKSRIRTPRESTPNTSIKCHFKVSALFFIVSAHAGSKEETRPADFLPAFSGRVPCFPE